MAANLVQAHTRSYELIKAANNDAMVSSNEATGNLPLPERADAGRTVPRPLLPRHHR